MKKFFKTIGFMFSFVWKHSKSWVFFIILQNIGMAIISLATVIVPKYIIDELQNGKRFYISIWIVLIYAGMVFILTQLNIFLRRSALVPPPCAEAAEKVKQ